jgi:cyclophilin family peptidyl-prolyl cis-trans isomerase
MQHRCISLPALALMFVAVACSKPSSQPHADPSAPAANIAEPEVDKYDQPFVKAVTEDVGPDQLLPPDRTIAGKSTAVLREAVERVWPTIKIADAAGKPQPWVAIFETDEGAIEIALRPDLAPNHCRNLLALVKVGYYDGLRFDRIVQQEAEAPDGSRSEVHLVRFGCPAGTGDPGIGHLGYRLRSEFSDTKHEIGTVGFTRDVNDPSSGGVRLYVTLAPAPALDGNFTIVGKVTKGMDVIVRIAAGKLLPPDVDPSSELPQKPVTIRKATARLGP